MYIESEDRLSRSADEVYKMVRDDLVKLLPYLPDVETITQQSHERENDTTVKVVNIWKANAKMPGLLAKFLPDDLFTWTDTATWRDDQNCVEYRLEGFGYEVEGKNFFTANGDGTTIKVTATVTIHPEKFKIPKLIFRKAFPLLEGTIKKAVQPNLTSLAKGLKQYFEAESEALG